MKAQSVLSLVAAVLLIALAVPAAWSAEAAPASRQAVLVYQASGGFSPTSFTGLTVYANGATTLSQTKASADKICHASASAAQIRTLQDSLNAAGALTLPSSAKIVPDLPTKIVTFFKPRKGTGQTPSNTFSYIAADGAYGKVQTAIDAFVSAVFPSC